jgi:hypothetical protein
MNRYLTIATLLLITSCNTTRDVVKESVDKKKETSTIKEEKKDVTTKAVVDLVLNEEEDGCIYEPEDKKSPMIIKGVSYYNVKISTVKKKRSENKKSSIEIIDNTISSENKKEVEVIKQEGKKIHKVVEQSWFTWIWWVILILSIIIGYKIYSYKY